MAESFDEIIKIFLPSYLMAKNLHISPCVSIYLKSPTYKRNLELNSVWRPRDHGITGNEPPREKLKAQLCEILIHDRRLLLLPYSSSVNPLFLQ